MNLIEINKYPVYNALPGLLKDMTTGKNIIFATDDYSKLKSADLVNRLLSTPSTMSHMRDRMHCSKSSEITPASLAAIELRPRVEKNTESPEAGIKRRSEIFTLDYIIDEMSSHNDTEWFESENQSLKESQPYFKRVTDQIIDFTKNKWQKDVRSTYLLPACDEAQFLTSRYDLATGDIIPREKRFGILDIKLCEIDKHTDSWREKVFWALHALHSCYGYEYRGDNLIIARINIFMTMYEFYVKVMECEPHSELLNQTINSICWNIWQMDGLKGTVPISGEGCKIKNWSTGYDVLNGTVENWSDVGKE